MKQVFLTGATGAIGSALTTLYLDEPDTKVRLLVRAKRGRAVSERLEELAHFWGWRNDDPRWSKVNVIEGDAALPRFGVSEAHYAELARSTTHIVHCAGVVKMTLPLEEARAHAVVPAQAVIELADRNRVAGVLEKIEIVSTVGVGGRSPGLIPERPMPEVDSFHNTYEAAKAEAERVLFARWHDLPITVHRPSMVVGESTTGRIIHFQVFYHLCEFLSGRRTSGMMPSLEGATLDVIPVDYVARAIYWSSNNPAATGKVLHLCSGPQGAVPLSDLVERIRVRAARAGMHLPRVRYLPLALFRAAVPALRLFAPTHVKRALGNLDLFLAYLEELQTFANADTRALLQPVGIRVPPAASYLDTVLDYYQQHRRQPEEPVAHLSSNGGGGA
jgi:thioester reductase-like protein